MRRVNSYFVSFSCLLVGSLMPLQGAAQTTTTITSSTDTAGAVAAPSATASASQQPPNGVEVEIGIASRIGGPKVANYQTTSGTLSLTNLGRATPQLLTGLGFTCETAPQQTTVSTAIGTSKTTTTTTKGGDSNGFCKNPVGKHLGAFVSVQFGSGSNQTITGYSVGTTYALYSNLRLLAGFSMSPISEISPGFENAASEYVSKNPTLFPGVNPANLASGAYGAFDGIQTTSTAPAAGAAPTAVIYYPGSVTETHYRGGFLIGVAFPINVYNLLSGNKSQ